ncbi:MAG: methyltransferase domain-containing protein [Planctomycetota bacterium]|nr:methyltransferase domain-containing protein [Planctomycetota bacterium]
MRRRQAEWMDDPAADKDVLNRSLRFIRRINAFLGYTSATLGYLEKFSKSWRPGEKISIVDLGTGSADIPLAILNWAKLRGFNVHIVAIDLHEATVAAALKHAGDDPRIKIVQGDVLAMPFAPASFDYAITGMFLHHLDDADVVQVLKTMDSLSRRGVIVADLLRHRSAYLSIKAVTTFSNPMVRHDAAASVAQAFTKSEVLSLRKQAGLWYTTYYRHFGHRFVLAGQKKGLE